MHGWRLQGLGNTPPTDYEAQLCRQECQSETQVADGQTCSLFGVTRTVLWVCKGREGAMERAVLQGG